VPRRAEDPRWRIARTRRGDHSPGAGSRRHRHPQLRRPPLFGPGYDNESVQRRSANLVYVAMIRATDHLNVVMLKQPESLAIANLVRVFHS